MRKRLRPLMTINGLLMRLTPPCSFPVFFGERKREGETGKYRKTIIFVRNLRDFTFLSSKADDVDDRRGKHETFLTIRKCKKGKISARDRIDSLRSRAFSSITELAIS